ncbi:MAG: hypothetical protein GY787_07990 [Alteromonadales bacterium]|nr:hypothetical protein [Alteromonadales bacterium]
MFKITKEYESKTVFCVPTGNNVRRYGNRDPLSQVEELKVSNVKRKYLDLGYITVSLHDNSKDFPHYRSKRDRNAGWIVFEDKASFEEYKTHQENCELVKTTLQRSYGVLPISASQVARIAVILREE